MIHNTKYEFNRIFLTRLNILILIIFSIYSIYTVYSGLNEFKDDLKEEKLFKKYEKRLFETFVNYHQYGDTGFRILYKPNELSIFFNQKAAFDNLFTHIDMSEIIELNKSFKGNKIQSNKRNIKDLSSLLYFLGSLLMLYMGGTSYKSERIFLKFENLLIRLFLLNVFMAFLLIILFNLPGISSINISNIKVLFIYGLYTLLFLNFFYASGFIIKVIFNRKLIVLISCVLFWFLLIVIIPEMYSGISNKDFKTLPSNESYNVKKIDELMNFEKEVKKSIEGIKIIDKLLEIYKDMAYKFLEEGYEKNKELEIEIIRNTEKIFKKIDRMAVIFPTTYYNFLCGEISSKGYSGYLSFVWRILKVRNDFVKFILKKRYDLTEEENQLENFVKNQENIFNAQSKIPNSFWKAFSIMAVITIVIFSISFFILYKRKKKKKETFDPGLDMAEGDMAYVLCKKDENENYLDKIYNHYQQKENTICVDNVKGDEIDPGIGLYQTARYYCKQMNARWDRTLEHIEKLGIKDLKKEKRSMEAVKKIYCAVCLAVEADTIVFKDFINRESRKFERQFLALLKDTMDMDRTIIYLGTDPLLLDSPFTGQEGVDKFRKYDIDDPLKFILR